MKEKLKAIFDSRITWTTIGTLAGAIFGQHAADIVNAVGTAVMIAI